MPNRPHLQLISITDGEEISNDALSIRGFQEYRCNDYHLGTVVCLCGYLIIVNGHYRFLKMCSSLQDLHSPSYLIHMLAFFEFCYKTIVCTIYLINN